MPAKCKAYRILVHGGHEGITQDLKNQLKAKKKQLDDIAKKAHGASGSLVQVYQAQIKNVSAEINRLELQKQKVPASIRSMIIKRNSKMLALEPNRKFQWTNQENGNLFLVGCWSDILETISQASSLSMAIKCDWQMASGQLHRDQLSGASLPGEDKEDLAYMRNAYTLHVSAAPCSPLTTDLFNVVHDPAGETVKIVASAVGGILAAGRQGLGAVDAVTGVIDAHGAIREASGGSGLYETLGKKKLYTKQIPRMFRDAAYALGAIGLDPNGFDPAGEAARRKKEAVAKFRDSTNIALIFSLYEEEGEVFFDTGKSELSQLEILNAATRAYDDLLKKRKLG